MGDFLILVVDREKRLKDCVSEYYLLLDREVRAYAIPGGSEEIMLDLGIRQAVKVAQFMGAKL